VIDDGVLDRSVSLLEELYNRTREGKLSWLDAGYDTAPDSSVPFGVKPTTHLGFRTQSGGFVLRIQMVPNEDFPSEPDYFLYIVSPDTDVIVETISNTTLGPALDRRTSDGHTPYILLKQIYETARRQARHVEDVLDRVLESLRQT